MSGIARRIGRAFPRLDGRVRRFEHMREAMIAWEDANEEGASSSFEGNIVAGQEAQRICARRQQVFKQRTLWMEADDELLAASEPRRSEEDAIAIERDLSRAETTR